MAEDNPFNVVMVEDDLAMARIYEGYLREMGYDLRHCEKVEDAFKLISDALPDVVLLDLGLPDASGFEVLKWIREQAMPTAVVVITGEASMNTAIEAMRLGAKDFLVKPFSKERLLTTLKNMEERQHLVEVVETYRKEIDVKRFQGFIGSSLSMQAVYRIIGAAARSKATVFITGESGTGKEVCAEAIHQQSARAKKPFIAINCSAIPQDLMESEIFGHVKGAFTGAHANRDGAAKQAEGGTLFLDEVCEMDLSLQPKLLRFLQTGRYQKVGGSGEQESDVRIVCATNRNPVDEVRLGRFREDLYYRLHVLPIVMPPLRDREGDVIEIAEYFLSRFTKEEGKIFQEFSDEAVSILAAYTWPGNVRQLQNVIRNIIVLHDGDQVDANMLPSPLDSFAAVSAPVMAAPTQQAPQPPMVPPGAIPSSYPTAPYPTAPMMPDDGMSDTSLGMSQGDSFGEGVEIRALADVERDAIQRAIRICDGNVPEAARHLGISAATIYRKKQVWGAEPGSG